MPLADDRISWIEEPSGLEAIWKKFAGGSKASPKLWMDAYLASHEAQQDATRRELEQRFPSADLREKLLSRRQSQARGEQ